jgi:hypothetical protein
MKPIFFILCILFTLAIYVNAAELYICIDLEGNSIVTDSPQDGMSNCVLKESSEKLSPVESANEKGKVITKEDNTIVKTKETPENSEKRINNCVRCCNDKMRTCYNYTADTRLCMVENQNCVATCNSKGSSPSSWSDCWSQSDNN